MVMTPTPEPLGPHPHPLRSLQPVPPCEVPADIPAAGLTVDTLLALHASIQDVIGLSWASVPILPAALGVDIQEGLRAAGSRVAVVIQALRLHELEAAGWRQVVEAGIWVRMVGKAGQCNGKATAHYETMEANGGNGLPVEDTLRVVDLNTVSDHTIRAAIALAIVRNTAAVDKAARSG